MAPTLCGVACFYLRWGGGIGLRFQGYELKDEGFGRRLAGFVGVMHSCWGVGISKQALRGLADGV